MPRGMGKLASHTTCVVLCRLTLSKRHLMTNFIKTFLGISKLLLKFDKFMICQRRLRMLSESIGHMRFSLVGSTAPLNIPINHTHH